MRIAILDDYFNAALRLADWSPLSGRAEIQVFTEPLGGKDIAANDAYGVEPLPEDHPLRKLDNVLLTPHLGYVSAENLARMYQDAIEDIVGFLDGNPVRVLK